MATQVVTKDDVPSEFTTVEVADIEVMSRASFRAFERSARATDTLPEWGVGPLKPLFTFFDRTGRFVWGDGAYLTRQRR